MEKLGRYSLIRKIGSGGMADVWKARAEGAAGFEKLVALKRVLPNLSVDEEFVEMFVKEAKLVAGLVHPNIVQVQEFGQEDGSYFIVMEYVAGSSGSALVKQLRDKGKRLSADIAIYIAAEASRALGYAHTEGIVHRDVSPHNILLSYRGAVKVADFGIAKVASSGTGTAMGVFKGKLRYASPEQARLLPLDGRSDLFSLGLVLFELLSGEPFFGMGRADEIVQAIVTVDPDRDSRVQAIDEKPLRAVLTKALQVDPNKRYASATALEQALLGLLGVEGTIAARTTLSQLLPILFKDEHAADKSDSPSGHTPAPRTPSPSAPFRPELTPPQGVMASAEPEAVLADATVAKGSPIALGPILAAREKAKARMPIVETGPGTSTLAGGPLKKAAKSPGSDAPRPRLLVPGLAVGALAIGAVALWASGILNPPSPADDGIQTPTAVAMISGRGFEIRRDGETVIDAAMVKTARAVNSGFGWSVHVSLTPAGATRFAEVSGASIGRPLAMVVDGKVVAEPIVQSRIENGEISVALGAGGDEASAREMANLITRPSSGTPVAMIRTPDPATTPAARFAMPGASSTSFYASPEMTLATLREAAAAKSEFGMLDAYATPYREVVRGRIAEMSPDAKAKLIEDTAAWIITVKDRKQEKDRAVLTVTALRARDGDGSTQPIHFALDGDGAWRITAPPSPTPTAVAIATSRPGTSTPRPTPTKKATPTPVVATTAPPTPRPTAVAVAATATGLLTVRADPWAEVWVDGKKLASETPMVKKAIPVGKRLVQLKNPVAGFDQSVSVEIAEGQLVILDADVQGGTIKRTK